MPLVYPKKTNRCSTISNDETKQDIDKQIATYQYNLHSCKRKINNGRKNSIKGKLPIENGRKNRSHYIGFGGQNPSPDFSRKKHKKGR